MSFILSSKKFSSEVSEEPPLTDLSGFFCGLLEPGKFAQVGSVRFVPFRWTNIQSLFVHILRLRHFLQIVGSNYSQLAPLLKPFLDHGCPKVAVLEATFRVVKLTLLTIYRFTATKTVKTLSLFVFGAYLPLG